MRQAVAFDMVRVIGQVDLGFVINATSILGSFFLPAEWKAMF